MSQIVEYRLTELLSFIVDNRGRTCPTSEFGIPLIATNCVKDDELYPVFENIRFVDETTYSTWFRAHPMPGDILFVCKGSPGRTALVPDPVSFCIAQDMVALRADPAVVNNRYLYYVLQSKETRNKIENMHVGTMIPHFKKGDFHKLILPIHSDLGEQQAIAEVLGALDDKIASNTKTAAIADELAAALSHQAMESGYEIPLAELAEVTMGSSPAGTSLNETGEGIVFYQGIRDFGLRYPTRRVWTDSPVRLAQELDTLLSVRAPVGNTNIASESVCIGRGLASIRSRLGTPYTLFHALRRSASWQQFNSEGTVFGSINRKQLESIHLKWVDSQDLQVVETQLSSLEQVIRIAATTIGTLTSTRDALLPQLMSGKLRVKDAEEIVEASI